MVVDELIAVLGYDLKGEKDLHKFNSSLERASKGITTLGVAAGSFVGTIAAGAFQHLGNLIGSLPGDIIATGSKFEGFQIQLEALEGSAEKAQKAMSWIQGFAKKTPLELDGVVEGYAQLRTYGLDPTNGTFQALVDTMAMAGKGQEYLQGVVMAVGQAWTKQKLQGEEAMQLLERGVPVWDLLAKKTGKSVQELMRLSSAGKLGRKEIALLIEAMGERAKGASDKFSKSMEGIKSNLLDTWTDFRKRIADRGFYDAVKFRLQDLLDYVGRLDADGTLDRWAQSLSDGLTRASDIIAELAKRFGRHFGTVSKIIYDNKDAWEWLKWVLGAIAFRLFPLTFVFGAAAAALDDFLTYMRDGDSVIGEFRDAIADFLGADPQKVADVMEAMAKSAFKLLGAAFVLTMFAGSIRKVAGAFGLLGGGAVAAGATGTKTKGGKFGLLSLIGLGSAISLIDEMSVESFEKGKSRGERWNKWLEENIGSPSSWLESISPFKSSAKAPMPSASEYAAPMNNPLAAFINAQDNLAKQRAGAAAGAVQQTLNDNSDKSVTVNVGGVTVNGVSEASAATGAAVGKAVGNSAASAATLPPSRIGGTGGL